MIEVSKRGHEAPNEKTVIVLEFVAASSILLIVALVLYMVFTYRPA